MRDALAEGGAFVTAQDLHARMKLSGSTVGVATVYRVLGRLAENGEADVYVDEDGQQQYRLCSSGHHHHLICRRCGATVEIQADAIEAWVRGVAEQNGYTQPSHVVDILGYCPRCTRELTARR